MPLAHAPSLGNALVNSVDYVGAVQVVPQNGGEIPPILFG